MPEYRIRVAPNTVAYADGDNLKLSGRAAREEPSHGMISE